MEIKKNGNVGIVGCGENVGCARLLGWVVEGAIDEKLDGRGHVDRF